jgi:hypothetical protein
MQMITKRGKRVRAIAILLLASVALWAAWQVSTHLWYVGEGGNWLGYCWGTVEECFREGGL